MFQCSFKYIIKLLGKNNYKVDILLIKYIEFLVFLNINNSKIENSITF